jgi:hypothetical protein
MTKVEERDFRASVDTELMSGTAMTSAERFEAIVGASIVGMERNLSRTAHAYKRYIVRAGRAGGAAGIHVTAR